MKGAVAINGEAPNISLETMRGLIRAGATFKAWLPQWPRERPGVMTMRKALLIAIWMTAVAGTTVVGMAPVDAQNRPQRPTFEDVCCGGPCCQRPPRR